MNKNLGIIYLSNFLKFDDEVIDEILKYFDASSCILIGEGTHRGLLIESKYFPLARHGCPLTYYHLQSIDPVIITEGKYCSSVAYFTLSN